MICEDLRGRDRVCFSEAGIAVKSNGRLACCNVMMAYNTKRAVVVVGRVGMVMGRSHERGKQEKQYQEG
jgi:Tfp pilus assembly protein FimT